MKKRVYVLFIFLIYSVLLYGQKKRQNAVVTNEQSTLIDVRDNKTYKTVKIGDQWWMSQNLDYEVPGSLYYQNTSRSAPVFGRLYTWQMAQEACPAGWHLPGDQDWMMLEAVLGIPDRYLDETDFRGTDQGKQLKLKGSSGFNAVLGGYRTADGQFAEMNIVGSYWTASEQTRFDAWGRGLEADNPQISRRTFAKDYYFSVRCVKD